MSNYSEGQIHQLADALERQGFTAEDVAKLTQLADKLPLLKTLWRNFRSYQEALSALPHEQLGALKEFTDFFHKGCVRGICYHQPIVQVLKLFDALTSFGIEAQTANPFGELPDLNLITGLLSGQVRVKSLEYVVDLGTQENDLAEKNILPSATGPFVWDEKRIRLHRLYSPSEDAPLLIGVALEYLATQKNANQKLLEYLLDHPELIPADWHNKEKFFLFAGGLCSVFKGVNNNDHLEVPGLVWDFPADVPIWEKREAFWLSPGDWFTKDCEFYAVLID